MSADHKYRSIHTGVSEPLLDSRFLDGKAALENSHISFSLLKFYLGVCKINYLPRVTPIHATSSGAGLLYELLAKCLRRISGGTLDSEVFKELRLPITVTREHLHIGISLASARGTAAAAFLSSASACNRLTEKALTGSALRDSTSAVSRKMCMIYGHRSASKTMFYRFRLFKLTDLRNKTSLRHSSKKAKCTSQRPAGIRIFRGNASLSVA